MKKSHCPAPIVSLPLSCCFSVYGGGREGSTNPRPQHIYTHTYMYIYICSHICIHMCTHIYTRMSYIHTQNRCIYIYINTYVPLTDFTSHLTRWIPHVAEGPESQNNEDSQSNFNIKQSNAAERTCPAGRRQFV